MIFHYPCAHIGQPEKNTINLIILASKFSHVNLSCILSKRPHLLTGWNVEIQALDHRTSAFVVSKAYFLELNVTMLRPRG